MSRALITAEPHFRPLGESVRLNAMAFVKDWETMVRGDGIQERIFAVLLGYAVAGITLLMYMNLLSLGVLRDAGRQFRLTVLHQLLVLKVSLTFYYRYEINRLTVIGGGHYIGGTHCFPFDLRNHTRFSYSLDARGCCNREKLHFPIQLL